MGNPYTAVVPETADTVIRMNKTGNSGWRSLSTQAWLRLGRLAQRAASRLNRLLALQAVARSWKYREVDGPRTWTSAGTGEKKLKGQH